MMRNLYYLSLFGLIASAVAHISTFFGITPESVYRSMFLLLLLFFVISFPVVFHYKMKYGKEYHRDFWKDELSKAHPIIRNFCSVLFVYVISIFIFGSLFLNADGNAEIVGGKKVIINKGTIIRELTDDEYDVHQAYSVRLISVVAMLLYSVGSVTLHSIVKDNPEKGT